MNLNLSIFRGCKKWINTYIDFILHKMYVYDIFLYTHSSSERVALTKEIHTQTDETVPGFGWWCLRLLEVYVDVSANSFWIWRCLDWGIFAYKRRCVFVHNNWLCLAATCALAHFPLLFTFTSVLWIGRTVFRGIYTNFGVQKWGNRFVDLAHRLKTFLN